MSLRFSTSRFDKAEIAPAGGLRVDATITRTGVFEYSDGKGGIVREWRPPEEVLHADSIASLRDAPVTVLHPRGGVSRETWRERSVGHVSGEAKADGQVVNASLVVNEDSAVRRIQDDGLPSEQRLRELSAGYSCDVEMTAGQTPDGQRYDAIQRNIRYNHVALGPSNWARLGSQMQLRLDSATGDEIPPGFSQEKKAMKIKIRYDGKEFEVEAGSPEHYEHQAKADAWRDGKLTALQTQHDEQKARADAAEDRAKKAEDALKTQPAEIKKQVEARSKLEADAKRILGDDFKCDGLTDRELRIKAIEKVKPDFKADGESDDYVRATFDLKLQDGGGAGAQEDLFNRHARSDAEGEHRDPVKARNDAHASQQQAWQKPLSVSKQAAQ